jgi:hypothetical protein
MTQNQTPAKADIRERLAAETPELGTPASTPAQEGTVVDEVLDVQHPVEAGLALASNAAKDVREPRTIEDIAADFTSNKVRLAGAKVTMEQALVQAAIAQVWMARDAYMAATHPDVLAKTPGQKVNNKGAATVLGMNVSTLRIHTLAGKALAEAGRADITSPPKEKDVAIVVASREVNQNAPRRESAQAVKQRQALALGAAGALGAIAPPAAPPADNGATPPPNAALTALTVLAAAKRLDALVETFVKGGGLFEKAQMQELEGLLTAIVTKSGAKVPAAKVPEAAKA